MLRNSLQSLVQLKSANYIKRCYSAIPKGNENPQVMYSGVS